MTAINPGFEVKYPQEEEEKDGDIPGSLTDWENEPSVEDLKADLEASASDHQEHLSNVQRWKDNMYIEGSAKIQKVKGRSSITPKLIRKQAEWRYPALSEPFLSTQDLFRGQPNSAQDKIPAELNVKLLNQQWNHDIDREAFFDAYVRTAVNEGSVIVRVGWETEEEEVNGEIKTTVNRPSVEVCEYNKVVIDPSCRGNLNKAGFVIFQFETSLAELEKEGDKYSNLDQINPDDSSILAAPDIPTGSGETRSFNFKDKPRKRFWAYEYWGYWDIHDTGMTVPIVATWVGDTMIRMEESPFPDRKIPFVLVHYLPRVHENYGEPDGELLEDNQKINGAITRGMIDIMGRSAAGQKGIRQDALDVTNRRKFEMGDDYEFSMTVDPRQAIYDHVYPEIPQSAQFMLQLQQIEAESLTGVKAFHQGLSGEAFGKVATAARGMMDAAGKREMGILRRLAKGLKEIGYKIIAMNQEFLSDEQLVVQTDEEEFVAFRREQLFGRFDVTLDISSHEMDNIKAQELAFMLQAAGDTVPAEIKKIILVEIAKLRKMPMLAKTIAEFQPQPDPMQIQVMQLEMAKLQAEVAKLQAETRGILAEGMLDAAKIGTEQADAQLKAAQAKKASSEADALNLDFLEKGSGAAHAKDMQKQGAQARANIQLKREEALLKDRNTVLNNLTRQPTGTSTG